MEIMQDRDRYDNTPDGEIRGGAVIWLFIIVFIIVSIVMGYVLSDYVFLLKKISTQLLNKLLWLI